MSWRITAAAQVDLAVLSLVALHLPRVTNTATLHETAQRR
ncbi:hypothetical protein ABID25_006408 [Mesorhizobium abyssinicae]